MAARFFRQVEFAEHAARLRHALAQFRYLRHTLASDVFAAQAIICAAFRQGKEMRK
jgi:hypothetical protein